MGAKQVRNELVRIHSLADVEEIIQQALEQPAALDDEGTDVAQELPIDAELDMSCAI